LVTCDIAEEIICTLRDDATQRDLDAALASSYYSSTKNETARWALKMAWKLAQPPVPVMCDSVITAQKPVCPPGWNYYTEYPFACTANCPMDSHSNSCLNTCAAPKHTCRRVSK
jgi:hypothetical protein